MHKEDLEWLLNSIPPSLREGLPTHPWNCPLPRWECDECMAFVDEIINNRWKKYAERAAAARKAWTWREKFYDWYTSKRYYIRQKIWAWRGCKGPRPAPFDDWALDKPLNRLMRLLPNKKRKVDNKKSGPVGA